ncbi:MAG: hypothetical protein JW940_37615 [Polyangiaceae bacterium]|nr:hypothetical protein [Polyangiaceae bacterium]
MKSLHTCLGWLTLTAVLSCAGLALGQTGEIERIDADTLQRERSARPAGTQQQDTTPTKAARKSQANRTNNEDAARHQYRHRWQKRSGTASSSPAASSQRTGQGAARQDARAGGKSTGQSTGLRNAVRRRDRIHATAADGQRDQARASDRLRTRQQRCSEAGEHRQQRRRAGASNAAAGGSGAGAARGGRQ